MKKTSTLIIIVLLVAGVFFYGGMKYSQSKTPTSLANYRFASSLAMRGNNRGSGFTGGQIISKDATSITLALQSGGSKIIFYTNATPVQKMVSGTIGDLSVGEQISVTGTTNSDGSISAESIQIRPSTTTPISR